MMLHSVSNFFFVCLCVLVTLFNSLNVPLTAWTCKDVHLYMTQVCRFVFFRFSYSLCVYKAYTHNEVSSFIFLVFLVEQIIQ